MTSRDAAAPRLARRTNVSSGRPTITSWTAEFEWPGSPEEARKRISQWTGDLEWNELMFSIDDVGTATATVTVEAETLLDAFDLVRQIVDGFLGPETVLERLAATDTF